MNENGEIERRKKKEDKDERMRKIRRIGLLTSISTHRFSGGRSELKEEGG